MKDCCQNNQLFPEEQYVSYRSFCNHYYKLVETIIHFSEKRRREGLLAIEDDIEIFKDSIFRRDMRMVFDGNDATVIRGILTPLIEREHDFYKKNLMEIAMEGILNIQAGCDKAYTAFMLASLADIKNNLLDTVCMEYLNGNREAFENIDFQAAIIPEKECEEILFIRRAVSLSNIARREGLLSLEKHLDCNGITERDIFEYGISFVIDRWDIEIIAGILDRLIEHEINPARKNFALAKKEAVMSIYNGENTGLLVEKICSYFGKNIEKIIFDELY
jgi:hypothetical protein